MDFFQTGGPLESAVRSLIPLGLIVLMLGVVRQASAALRHGLLLAGILVALVLPLISPALPAWELAVLPAAEVDDARAVLLEPADVGKPLPWLLIVWSLGVVLVLARVSAGWLALHLATRRACDVRDARPLGILKVLRWELGVRQDVNMVTSPEAAMPATWGLLRPTILLPRESCNWSDSKTRAVLLHELAHVRRRDCLTQLVAQAACAIYWFNPLIWWCGAMLRKERERAADDYVLRDGAPPSGYASLLLQMTRRWRWTSAVLLPSAALGSAPLLASRVRAILDERQRREGFPLLVGAVALVLVLAAGTISAILRPTRQDPPITRVSEALAAEPKPVAPSKAVACVPLRPEAPPPPREPPPLEAAPIGEHAKSRGFEAAPASPAPQDLSAPASIAVDVAKEASRLARGVIPVLLGAGTREEIPLTEHVQETVERTIREFEASGPVRIGKSAKKVANVKVLLRIVLRN
jgi:beta-lactamase regulating signal transducer with metallopeptidase domain